MLWRQRDAPTNGELPAFLLEAIRRSAADTRAFHRTRARWRRRVAASPELPIALREHLSGSQTLRVGERETHFEVAPTPAELLDAAERLLERS